MTHLKRKTVNKNAFIVNFQKISSPTNNTHSISKPTQIRRHHTTHHNGDTIRHSRKASRHRFRMDTRDPLAPIGRRLMKIGSGEFSRHSTREISIFRSRDVRVCLYECVHGRRSVCRQVLRTLPFSRVNIPRNNGGGKIRRWIIGFDRFLNVAWFFDFCLPARLCRLRFVVGFELNFRLMLSISGYRQSDIVF